MALSSGQVCSSELSALRMASREVTTDLDRDARKCSLLLPSLHPANVLPFTRARPLRAGGATRRVALEEPRKRRARQRPRVGCYGELAGVVAHKPTLVT